jgi:hypothetical protein
LGHQYRTVDKFYLDPVCALQWALPNLAIPEGMGARKPCQNSDNLLENSPKSSNALDVLRGLGRDELVKLLSELLAGNVPA